MFFVVKRATLLIPSGPLSDPNKKHLFICLTDAVGLEKETLIVSVSTLHQGIPVDETCRLFDGDHPFIKRKSFVDYKNSRITKAEKLVKGVSQGIFVAMDALESSVFARVCFGLTLSPMTATKHLEFYRRATGHE
jgi:hypothetical protein